MKRESLNSLRGACVLCMIFSLALLAGCSRKSHDNATARRPAAAVPVLAAQALQKDVPVQIRAIGNVTPYSRVTIRSQITGQLQAVHFKDGQDVKAGDLLFTIDPRPLEASLDQEKANLARSEAQLENAKVEFGRSEKLQTAQLISQEEFDTSRSAMKALQMTVLADRATLSNAALSLAYTSIRSPVDGVAGAQLVFPGNIVKSPDDQMLTVNQVQPIYVSFAVPEQTLPEIRRQMRNKPLKVTATFSGLTEAAPQGELTFVDNTVDTTTGTIMLKATFPNEDRVLWPGQFVQVQMQLTELQGATVVPSQAIQTGQNGEYVFVIKEDQTVEMRPVKAGTTYLQYTVVTEGVRPGETVVTDGQMNLVAGKAVSVKTSQTAGGPTNGTAGAAP